MAGYEAFTVTIGEEGTKQEYPFLMRKIKSIVRVPDELSADRCRRNEED